jgi:dipeptidyl aminopeptidase/acylaminoacyl peptidase
MALAAGTKLGPFEILSPLGAGGMGEVYRAKDTRLDRTVAVKVLPPHHSSNPERRQRFEREAKTISSLNHPHICALYDIGKHEETDYLVLEYLEGESLAARLEKGPLPSEQLLRIAVEIADALAAAHRHGVTHRDLKPGNIMLTKAGAKLLDFGLAKPASLPVGSATTAMVMQSKPMTAEGAILGTFQYMAPEQLEGKEADARSDIFSFGGVLYEMATGKKAFEGKTQASVIAAVLASQPAPISTIQPMSPPALDRVVKKCLAKDPDERWQSVHDLRDELKWVMEAGSQAGVPAPVVPRRRSRERLVVGALIGLSALLLTALGALVVETGVFQKPKPKVGAVRFSISPPDGYAIAPGPFAPQVAVSPDGRMIAVALADSKGKNSLWVRPLSATTAQKLDNTDGAHLPFWSPDGQFIGFFADGKLKKIPVTGDSPQTICDAGSGDGASWSQAGVILFGQGDGPVMRVGAAGGGPVPVTELEKGKVDGNVWPQFLADSKHFLYLAVNFNTRVPNSVYIGSLDSPQAKFLMKNQSAARFYAPSRLLFVRNGTLLSQAFDSGRMEVKGEPIRIAEGINASGNGRAAFSTSNNGLLAFRSGTLGEASPQAQLAWHDRKGKKLAQVGPPGDYFQAVLSPNEKFVALQVQVVTDPNHPDDQDIWLLDLTNGVYSRQTFGPAPEFDPTWSPDSREILYALNKPGEPQIMELELGSSQPKRLYADGKATFLDDWSADGKFLIYHDSENTSFHALPMAGEHVPIALWHDAFNRDQVHFSPDGKWVAYSSNESGQLEVYVASFPKLDQKKQVSNAGGAEPLWRRDGKELYFLSLDGNLMAVTANAGATIDTGPPKALFRADVLNPSGDLGETAYNVSRDGQKFLLLEPVNAQAKSVEQINVIVNWDAALQE